MHASKLSAFTSLSSRYRLIYVPQRRSQVEPSAAMYGTCPASGQLVGYAEVVARYLVVVSVYLYVLVLEPGTPVVQVKVVYEVLVEERMSQRR